MPNHAPCLPFATSRQRRAAIEYYIVAILAPSSEDGKSIPFTRYELGRALYARPMLSDWLRPSMIDEALYGMLESSRIVLVYSAMRTLPSYALPEDPMLPIVGVVAREEKRRKVASAVERHVIASMNWPKFFRIPSKEDLVPYSRTRTGYDPQVDMNRF